MSKRFCSWTGAVAAGLVLGLAGCGYIEDLIEDNTTGSPADVSGFTSGDVALYGKVATYIGLIDGVTQDFGTSAASLAKAGDPRLTPRAGTTCATEDWITIDPATYTSALALDTMEIDYIYGATDSCLDMNTNPLTGMYTILATGLADETWPATAAQFADFDSWTRTGATLRYEFMDMSAVLAGPGITTLSNGVLSVDETATSQHAVNKGNIKVRLDDGTNVITAFLSKVDLTKAIGATESTTGTFRIALTLFGYLDVTLDTVVVDICPNHPDSGTVGLMGKSGLSVSLDFGTGTCNTADVTLSDGTVVPGVVIQPIF